MEETDGLTGRINEFTNLLEQLGDIEAKRRAGLLDDEAYAEQKAKQLAYISALETLAAGEEVDDEAFAEILEEMEAVVAEPTQEEINAANIDYLLMIGGEE